VALQQFDESHNSAFYSEAAPHRKASERVDSANGRLTITGYTAALAISRKWWAFLYATRETGSDQKLPTHRRTFGA
jgi:hypothetical protein